MLVCCSVLQCVIVRTSWFVCALSRYVCVGNGGGIVVRCSVMQRVAVRCSALQCVAVRCSALQCVAVCYGDDALFARGLSRYMHVGNGQTWDVSWMVGWGGEAHVGVCLCLCLCILQTRHRDCKATPPPPPPHHHPHTPTTPTWKHAQTHKKIFTRIHTLTLTTILTPHPPPPPPPPPPPKKNKKN